MQKKPAEAKFFSGQSQSYDFHWEIIRICPVRQKNGRDGVKSSQKTSHKKCTNQGPPLGVHTGALILHTFLCVSFETFGLRPALLP